MRERDRDNLFRGYRIARLQGKTEKARQNTSEYSNNKKLIKSERAKSSAKMFIFVFRTITDVS